MHKQYYIIWSYIYNLINHKDGIKKPWVVKCEGSMETWIFPTLGNAKEWVAKQDDGDLCGTDTSEMEFLEKRKGA